MMFDHFCILLSAQAFLCVIYDFLLFFQPCSWSLSCLSWELCHKDVHNMSSLCPMTHVILNDHVFRLVHFFTCSKCLLMRMLFDRSLVTVSQISWTDLRLSASMRNIEKLPPPQRNVFCIFTSYFVFFPLHKGIKLTYFIIQNKKRYFSSPY